MVISPSYQKSKSGLLKKFFLFQSRFLALIVSIHWIPTKVGNLKGYLFWPPFLKVFCQKWKFGRAKEMSASAGIWTRVPRSKGSYAIQWATLLLIENQQKLASYNNFCFGPFLTKNFQKGNGQNRYIFELLTLVYRIKHGCGKKWTNKLS